MLGSPRLFCSYAHTGCPGMGFHVHGKCLAEEAAFASGFIDSERGPLPQSQWRRARRLSTNSDVDVSNDSEQSTRTWSASSGQGRAADSPVCVLPFEPDGVPAGPGGRIPKKQSGTGSIGKEPGCTSAAWSARDLLPALLQCPPCELGSATQPINAN